MSAAERAIILGGHGGVGTLVGGCLEAHGVEVVAIDRVPPADQRRRWVCDDVAAPAPATLQAVEDADLVVLALPEAVAIRAISRLAAHLRPAALLVDTLSVKSAFLAAVAELRLRCEIIGINPLFAPSLGWPGQAVAQVTVVGGPRARWFLQLFEHAGARVVALAPHDHDRLLAPVQVLAHAAVLAFGTALHELAADALPAGAAPPPHRLLLSLLARILGGAPHAYWDIQASNPHAAAVRAALAAAIRRIAGIVDAGRVEEFHALFDVLRTAHGSELAKLQGMAERVLRAAAAHPL